MEPFDAESLARQVLEYLDAGRPVLPLLGAVTAKKIDLVASVLVRVEGREILRLLSDRLLDDTHERPFLPALVADGLRRHDPGLALTVLDTCTHPDEFAVKARIYEELGWMARAEKELALGVEAFPGAYSLHARLGGLAWDRRDWERARHAYQAFMKLQRPGRALPGLGRIRGRLGILQDEGLGPGSTRTRVLLGWQRLYLGSRTSPASLRTRSPDEPVEHLGPRGVATILLHMLSLARAWGWPFRAVVPVAIEDAPIAAAVGRIMDTPVTAGDELGENDWGLAVKALSGGVAPPRLVTGLRDRGVHVVRLDLLVCAESEWVDPPELIGEIGPAEGRVMEIKPGTHRPLKEAARDPDLPAPSGAGAVPDVARELLEALDQVPIEPPDRVTPPASATPASFVPVLRLWRDWSWPRPGAPELAPIEWTDLDALADRGRIGDLEAMVLAVESGVVPGEVQAHRIAGLFLDGAAIVAPVACGPGAATTLKQAIERLQGGPAPAAAAGSLLPRLLAWPPFAHRVLEALAGGSDAPSPRSRPPGSETDIASPGRTFHEELARSLEATGTPSRPPPGPVTLASLPEAARILVKELAPDDPREAELLAAMGRIPPWPAGPDTPRERVLAGAASVPRGLEAGPLVRLLDARDPQIDAGLLLDALGTHGDPDQGDRIEYVAKRTPVPELAARALRTLARVDPATYPERLVRVLDRTDPRIQRPLLLDPGLYDDPRVAPALLTWLRRGAPDLPSPLPLCRLGSERDAARIGRPGPGWFPIEVDGWIRYLDRHPGLLQEDLFHEPGFDIPTRLAVARRLHVRVTTGKLQVADGSPPSSAYLEYVRDQWRTGPAVVPALLELARIPGTLTPEELVVFLEAPGAPDHVVQLLESWCRTPELRAQVLRLFTGRDPEFLNRWGQKLTDILVTEVPISDLSGDLVVGGAEVVEPHLLEVLGRSVEAVDHPGALHWDRIRILLEGASRLDPDRLGDRLTGWLAGRPTWIQACVAPFRRRAAHPAAPDP